MPHALDKSLANHPMIQITQFDVQTDLPAPAQPLGCKPKIGANGQPDLITWANLLPFEACAAGLRGRRLYPGGEAASRCACRMAKLAL